MSPAKWYKVDRKRVYVNNFVMEALKLTVQVFYHEKKYPTLYSLLEAVKQKGVFNDD